MSPKKTRTHPLDQLITHALGSIGADRLPAAARRAIDADALTACETMLHKRITGDYVGRMVALGLAAQAEWRGRTISFAKQIAWHPGTGCTGRCRFPSDQNLGRP